MQDLTKLSNLNLNHLVVLLAIMRTGSVTEAANILGRSQSAISHALSRLREDLDDALFVRSGMQLVPTQRAQKISQKLEEIFPELGTTLFPPETFDPMASEVRFRIAGSDLAMQLFAPALSPMLQDIAPQISVQLVRYPRLSELSELLATTLDFALTVPLPDDSSLHTMELYEEDFGCVVHSSHPGLSPRQTFELDAYCESRHLLVSPGEERRELVDEALAALGRERLISLVIPDFLLVGEFLETSGLVATLPTQLAQTLAARHASLLHLPLPFESPRMKIKLVWHERTHLASEHIWMRGLLKELIQKRRASDIT